MNDLKYDCTNCGKSPGREHLTAKKAVFVEMGVGGPVQRSRVVAWLCNQCKLSDPDWNRPKFAAQRKLIQHAS